MSYADDIISLTKELGRLAILNGKLQAENEMLKSKLISQNEMILEQLFGKPNEDTYAVFVIDPSTKEVYFKQSVPLLDMARFIAESSNTNNYKIYKLVETEGE